MAHNNSSNTHTHTHTHKEKERERKKEKKRSEKKCHVAVCLFSPLCSLILCVCLSWVGCLHHVFCPMSVVSIIHPSYPQLLDSLLSVVYVFSVPFAPITRTLFFTHTPLTLCVVKKKGRKEKLSFIQLNSLL